MCGISGIISPSREEAESALRRMVPTMMHRGPDDAGQNLFAAALGGQGQGWVGFGFRRLAILDLSPAGHQPIVHPDTGDCLIFNGEIYNFQSLRKELEARGCRFRSSSDTEVLLQALVTWGESALERLDGMYALGFFDRRTQRVMLARDPLGIKPLYVGQSRDGIVFASEVRTVLASDLVARSIDEAGVAGMLAFGAVQGEKTVFSAVRAFPAGCSEWIGSPRRRFWNFPSACPSPPCSEPEARVRDLVTDAVQSHLVADVPVGIFLSAGIDSTVIALCAAQKSSQVTAFTVRLGEQYAGDEVVLATETANSLGMRHEVVDIAPSELQSLWGAWIGQLDSPSIDGFNTYLVTKRLADHGIKVGLSGLGGDELFGGYRVFDTAPWLSAALKSVPFFIKPVAAQLAEAFAGLAGRQAFGEKLADVITGSADVASVTVGMRRVLSNRRLRSLGSGRVVVNTEAQGHCDSFNMVSRTELSHYMRDMLLRDTDANSMRHSLEVRVPFLHRPLVEFVSSLPGQTKSSHGGLRKRLLREAFASQIPQSVVRRRKTGFSLPISDWMRSEMRDMCEHSIESLADVHCLDSVEVGNTWRAFLKNPQSMVWSRPFALVVLGRYLSECRGGSNRSAAIVVA